MHELAIFKNPHYRRAATRREFFTRAGSGLAGIALAQNVAGGRSGGAASPSTPWLPRSRIIRPRPSPSSGSSWKAARATSICSTPSPSCRNSRATASRFDAAEVHRHARHLE